MQQQKKKKPPKPLIFSEVDNVQCVICAHVIYCESKIQAPVVQDSSENIKQSFFSPLSLMKQVEAVARASYCQAQR